MYALILFAYWLIFWQKFLRNPYLLSTSEIASTNFPHWIWMGREWRATDNLYYKFPASIPFLSMWYWPNVLLSKVARIFSLDAAFKLYTYFILFHYYIASLIAYKVFGLFGAITLTYAGYCIKPQTPSFVYTMCWIPGMFIKGWFGIFSAGMAVLGGYWPILVYVLPVAAIVMPASLIGLILGLPQIIPFLKYWPKSVRDHQRIDLKFGRVPWWKLSGLIRATSNVSLTNGVHYPEVAIYIGIAPLFIFHLSWWWVPLIISLLISFGILPPVQRIAARVLYLASLCLCFLSTQGILSSKDLHLVYALTLIQALCLLRNNSAIYPSFPFSQWWKRPSQLYPAGDYTGYLENRKINDYRGGFCLKEAS